MKTVMGKENVYRVKSCSQLTKCSLVVGTFGRMKGQRDKVLNQHI